MVKKLGDFQIEHSQMATELTIEKEKNRALEEKCEGLQNKIEAVEREMRSLITRLATELNSKRDMFHRMGRRIQEMAE